MRIAIIDIYNNINARVEYVRNFIESLKEEKHSLELWSTQDSNSKNLYGLTINKLKQKSIPMQVEKGFWRKFTAEKNAVNILDEIYKLTNNSNIDAAIIPVAEWKFLYYIQNSFIQLTDKNLLFCINDVPDNEFNDFMSWIKYIDRYRNIHVGIYQDKNRYKNFEKLYNLHLLKEEKINDIVKLHINNRRKYIGLKYKLNELRQKIKFYKDLFKHRIMVMLNNPYKERLDSNTTIPKVIHYCWFGGKPMPANVKKFVDSWYEALPGYEIKCWNESNFPIEKYPFAKEAQKNKKWAFMADVARLHALYYEGGIYLDTDVEVVKNFDEFLDKNAFTSYESLNLIAMAAIGSKKYNPWISSMLVWYNIVHCDEDYTEIANTKIVSKITKGVYGINLDGKEKQIINLLHIYPREYFSPEFINNNWNVTEKTYCIHHFTGMW